MLLLILLFLALLAIDSVASLASLTSLILQREPNFLPSPPPDRQRQGLPAVVPQAKRLPASRAGGHTILSREN